MMKTDVKGRTIHQSNVSGLCNARWPSSKLSLLERLISQVNCAEHIALDFAFNFGDDGKTLIPSCIISVLMHFSLGVLCQQNIRDRL